MAKKSPPQKFDALFGLTYAIHYQDSWLHDNECWGNGGELEKVIKKLGRAWKKLLAYDDATLGIDSQFSRPGVEALLEKFEGSIEDEESVDVAFDWRPAV
jgi:hypothetical protein